MRSIASAKGHEYFLRHYLGTHSNAIADETAQESVKEIQWRENAPQGKMDLVVDLKLPYGHIGALLRCHSAVGKLVREK